MRFTEAANVAHRSINRVLPQTEIVYNGQTYRGYMNSRDITIERQEGGYCNQRGPGLGVVDGSFTVGNFLDQLLRLVDAIVHAGIGR